MVPCPLAARCAPAAGVSPRLGSRATACGEEPGQLALLERKAAPQATVVTACMPTVPSCTDVCL